jgi:glycosyltransferase involved in cell wall biosynthesis
MNILFLASTLPRFANDLQAPFVLEQAQAWKDQWPDERIFILAPHDSLASRHELLGGVEIFRFQYFFPASLQALAYPAILPNVRKRLWVAVQILPFLWAEYRVAKRLIEKYEINLIYAHWVMPQGLVARWLSKRTGTPFVIQNHSSDLSVFSKFGNFGRETARNIVRDACAMFCVNSNQKRDALDLFTPTEAKQIETKMTVLPMGVDIEAVRSRRSEDIPAPCFHFGTIARLSKKKGIDLLIRAGMSLSKTSADVAVGVAGEGEEGATLRALAKDQSITFVGFVSGPEKWRFFEQTQFMVFPSVARDGDVEGMPVALLEALCCGKVVAASADTNIKLLEEWEAIKGDIMFIPEPTDIEAFAGAMKEMLALDPDDIAERKSRLETVMSRYYWSNLIHEYKAAIPLTVNAKQK